MENQKTDCWQTQFRSVRTGFDVVRLLSKEF
jgi:hypothetical protein